MSSERGLLVFQAQRVERDGGMAWLLFGGVFMAVATLVFAACALCAAVSLFTSYQPATIPVRVNPIK